MGVPNLRGTIRKPEIIEQFIQVNQNLWETSGGRVYRRLQLGYFTLPFPFPSLFTAANHSTRLLSSTACNTASTACNMASTACNTAFTHHRDKITSHSLPPPRQPPEQQIDGKIKTPTHFSLQHRYSRNFRRKPETLSKFQLATQLSSGLTPPPYTPTYTHNNQVITVWYLCPH